MSTLTDGSNFTFTSNSTILHGKTTVFMGGLNGINNTVTIGDAFDQHFPTGFQANSTNVVTGWQIVPLFFRSSGSLSRNTCLQTHITVDGDGSGRPQYMYDTGGTYTELYARYNVKCVINDPNITQFQWKRERPSQNGTVTDGVGNASVLSGWYNTPGDSYLTYFNTAGTSQSTWYFGDHGQSDLPNGGDGWFIMETWAVPNTNPGTANGKYLCRTTNVSTGTVTDRLVTGWMPYSNTDSSNYRWWVMQNYFGNGAGTGVGEYPNVTLYIDDLYVSSVATGTGACERVILGNASTIGACTQFALCPIVSKSGTDLTVNINKGYLSATTGLYLYEYDSTNTVITSSGPHSFGSGGSFKSEFAVGSNQ